MPFNIKLLFFVSGFIFLTQFGTCVWLYNADIHRDIDLKQVETNINELNDAVIQSKTAWVTPLSVSEGKLFDRITELENSITRLQNSNVNNEAIQIVTALYLLESMRWSDDPTLQIQLLIDHIETMDDIVLKHILVDISAELATPQHLWYRLQYLLWESLQKQSIY